MKTEAYRQTLRTLPDWDQFLMKESGLPGPRGNLELMQAVADEGTLDLFQRYLTYTPDRASTNSPEGFLAMCGVVGLGRLLAEGDLDQLAVLRVCANDPRWRVREAVAMGLQRWGDADMPALLKAMSDWVKGHAAGTARGCRGRVRTAPVEGSQTCQTCAQIIGCDHGLDRAGNRSAGRGLQDAASSVGLLLERGRGRFTDRRQTGDGEVARQSRCRCGVDHARELEEESPAAHGCEVGERVESVR